MIAGLMTNRSVGNINSTPGVGDLPIIGTLFRSDNFRRGDTELVIVVTPYLVRPVNANDIVLPTDGFRNPTDLQRLLFNGIADGENNASRPMPTLETGNAAPANGAAAPVPGISAAPSAPAQQQSRSERRNRERQPAAATPGFSFNR